METYKEEVLFNSDTLSKIISYLPSVDLLNLAITCKRFGISDDDDPSLIEKSAQIIVQDIATEAELAALPRYDGESSLADYHYLQLLREPLAFDQLVGAEYVNEDDKTCIRYSDRGACVGWKTAFSNNILRTGKHYVSFTPLFVSKSLTMGVMRPGQANQNANGTPLYHGFYQNFFWNREDCNSIQCCVYNAYDGKCYSSGWDAPNNEYESWEGMEASMYSVGEIGMMLDLDERSLSVYKNGRKLGVMKRGLAGQYCWVVSLLNETGVTIKRGALPP